MTCAQMFMIVLVSFAAELGAMQRVIKHFSVQFYAGACAGVTVGGGGIYAYNHYTATRLCSEQAQKDNQNITKMRQDVDAMLQSAHKLTQQNQQQIVNAPAKI